MATKQAFKVSKETERLKSLLQTLSSLTPDETKVLEAMVDLSRMLRQPDSSTSETSHDEYRDDVMV